MAVAPLYFVCDYFFRAPRSAASSLRLMRLGRVIHIRVKVPLPLQALANIAFSLFQKVRVNGTLLINGD